MESRQLEVPGRWRRPRRFGLRLLSIGFLGAGVLLPVGEVHSTPFPKIQKLIVRGNDLTAVRGVGAPNQLVGLWVRRRSFREDDQSPLDLNCPGNSSQWLQIGDLINVDANGRFAFDGLDLMVLPAGTGFQSCNAALLTEFVVGFGVHPDDGTPLLHMLNLPNYTAGDPEKWVEADVEFADEVGVSITDGPDSDPDALGGVDMDEDGVDLCATGGLGCGHRITYMGSGGTFTSPSIFEHDGSVFGIPEPKVDDEYGFILSMVEAHAPGMSFLAAAKVPRDHTPTGGSLQVNVNVKAKLGIDCNGGLFDYMKTP
jgi:hypothetical protein